MPLTISVIICTRNRVNDLANCLESLTKQTERIHELIIVDSSDLTLKKSAQIKPFFDQKRHFFDNLIYLHTKPGLTYQRNVGIKRASGDTIYFFDDDVELETNYLKEMNAVFEQHPEYAGGMGAIKNLGAPPSWRYRWYRSFFLLPRLYASGKFTWSGMPTHPYGGTQFKNVEILGGCCMAFRREALQQHLFDEQLRGYCYMEDADIARRISFEHSLFYNPRAQLVHHESPVARDQLVDRSAMLVYNYSYLFFKNSYPRRRLKIIAYYWSLLGLFLEALLMRDTEKITGYKKGLKQWYARRAV